MNPSNNPIKIVDQKSLDMLANQYTKRMGDSPSKAHKELMKTALSKYSKAACIEALTAIHAKNRDFIQFVGFAKKAQEGLRNPNSKVAGKLAGILVSNGILSSRSAVYSSIEQEILTVIDTASDPEDARDSSRLVLNSISSEEDLPKWHKFYVDFLNDAV